MRSQRRSRTTPTRSRCSRGTTISFVSIRRCAASVTKRLWEIGDIVEALETWEANLSWLYTVLLPLILGGIGWIILEFIGRPIRIFFDLRREASRLLNLHWASSDASAPSENAKNDFREIGLRLIAFDKSEPLAAPFVRMLGYRPLDAGERLRRFGWGLRETPKKFPPDEYEEIATALKF
jgi:hypothetical protein